MAEKKIVHLTLGDFEVRVFAEKGEACTWYRATSYRYGKHLETKTSNSIYHTEHDMAGWAVGTLPEWAFAKWKLEVVPTTADKALVTRYLKACLAHDNAMWESQPQAKQEKLGQKCHDLEVMIRFSKGAQQVYIETTGKAWLWDATGDYYTEPQAEELPAPPEVILVDLSTETETEEREALGRDICEDLQRAEEILIKAQDQGLVTILELARPVVAELARLYSRNQRAGGVPFDEVTRARAGVLRLQFTAEALRLEKLIREGQELHAIGSSLLTDAKRAGLKLEGITPKQQRLSRQIGELKREHRTMARLAVHA